MIDWLHETRWTWRRSRVRVLPGATLIGSAFLQPLVGQLLRGEKNPNTLVGLLLNAFALYYGVLLALLSIAVFDNYDKARMPSVRKPPAS